MMLLLQENIPEFFRSSPYLQSLLSNGPFPEEGLEIPDGSGKQDLTVKSQADLIELLSTLRFWLVPEVAEQSSDLLRFALLPASQGEFVELTAEFRNDIPFVDELLHIVTCTDDKRLEIAAKYGRLFVLQFLCEKVGLEPTSQAACVAAGEGHLDCLTYLHSRGMELSNNIIEAAARGGHFNCAKYIVESHRAPAFWMMESACATAAVCGHLACVKQMLAEWGASYFRSAEWVASLKGAATGGHLELLRYITSIGHDEKHVLKAMLECVRYGHLGCLEHLHSLGYERHADLMCNASTAGHLNCLKFLHEHNYPPGRVCFGAASHGRLKCLKYAHEQGIPWNEYTCAVAAERGHLACLQYMREQGCPWWDGPAVADLPVNSRNIHCTNRIKVAVDSNHTVQVGNLIAASACCAPAIDCLLYVLEQGASLSPKCATHAASSGSLATLQFLHARGFTWEARDCAEAAYFRSLECLRFLHKIGTPWDERTIENAARGASDTLWWVTEQQRNQSRQCYEYAVAHGCSGTELHKLPDVQRV